MGNRKICVVIGSRANYGRLKSVCNAIQDHFGLELQLIIAASAYDLPIDLPVAARVQCLIDGDNTGAMALTAGVFLTQLSGVFERLKPDLVLAHGDRYEVLSAAITAAYMNIPLAHTEGGEFTGTIDNKVRYAITSLADFHFPVTRFAADKLKSLGIDPGRIFTVGSTALDTIKGIDLTNERAEHYMVILHHPNTTNPEELEPLIEAVNKISLHKVWVNPNVDAGNKAMLKLIHQQKMEFVKNLPPEEYARLIYNCQVLVGNTSSGIKEGAFLGVPYVCVGNRQQGREHGNNTLMVPNRTDDIFAGILWQLNHGRYPPDYRFGDGTAGAKIANILAEVES